MKLRDKFRANKIKRQESPVPFEEKAKKLRRKKVYVKEKCHFIKPDGKRCTRNAIGSGQMCAKHGGSKDLSTTMSAEALQLLQIEVGGLVTRFDPSVHPLQMIGLSQQGCSPVEIAAEMGISVETLKGWADKFEEMSRAFDIAKTLHESWWLAKGKDGLSSKFFNTALYKFLTGQTLGYSDKTESKNTNMNLNGVLVVPAPKNMEEWELEGQNG